MKSNVIALSYDLWVRTCIEDTHAFVITVNDKENEEELLGKLEELLDRKYPDIRHIKHFPIVRRNEDEKPIGFALRDRYNTFILTRRDLEIILKEITRKPAFTITDARDFSHDNDMILLGHPTGCPWIPQSTF